MFFAAKSGRAKATTERAHAGPRREAQPRMSDRRRDERAPWRSRLLWLVGLWAASVFVAGSGVAILRVAMEAAGFRTH